MIIKVLLIEDDTTLRESTAELLELANYKVITAPDGEKGVLTAKAAHPDVIICDIMMPKLDGYGVLKALSCLLYTSPSPRDLRQRSRMPSSA